MESFTQMFLSGYELKISLNFVICIVVGILIGADREKKGKSAGVSTHSMVASGSMLFSFISHVIGGDPGRIAAQVVVGVGFLGGGIMVRDGFKISNVTTAAGIWFTAAVGMVVGFGYYSIALLSVLFAYIIFKQLPHFDSHKDS